MTRIVIVNILLLLLPTILYLAYVYIHRKNAPDKELLSDAPIFWLLFAGVVVMLIGLVFLGQWESGGLEGQYVPPRFEDGVIVPGHVDRPG